MRQPIRENEIVVISVCYEVSDNQVISGVTVSEEIDQLGIDDRTVRVQKLTAESLMCGTGQNADGHDLVFHRFLRHLIGNPTQQSVGGGNHTVCPVNRSGQAVLVSSCQSVQHL